MTEKEAKQAQPLAKAVYDSLIKLGWEGWKPQVGEWYMDEDDEVHCVGDKLYLEHVSYLVKTGLSEIIPLLHWERIRTIIQELGFNVEVKICNEKLTDIWMNTSYREGPIPIKIVTDKPQTAMMQAVIELGKEE